VSIVDDALRQAIPFAYDIASAQHAQMIDKKLQKDSGPKQREQVMGPGYSKGERLDSGNPRPRPQCDIQKTHGLMAQGFFESALVIVRFDHVASPIGNAAHSIV
jgi:hypothetical protein